MLKWIETTGRTEEDAISAALFQLGLDRDDVSIEVIERAKAGFLGFGSNPAKVRVSYEEENGVPKPLQDLIKEEVFSVVREEKQPASARGEKKEKQPEATKAAPAPVKQAAEPAAPAAPAQPVEEETILAAKPGWQPSRAKGEPRPQQHTRRGERQGKRQEKAAESQLQEGDEVVIGTVPENLTPAGAGDEKAARITEFLTGLMEHLQVQAVPEVYTTAEGGYKVVLQGQNLGAIIGRRGETLDAIQQLTSYCVNRGQSKRVRIHVDAEGYRSKREESLQRLAVKVAGKVVKYRKNMTLEPMNAYERHVIHTALQDYPNVTTYSVGVEPNRRTVVAYAPGQK